MSEIVGFDITPDAGTTLRKVLKLNLYPFLVQFEEISVGATKVIILTSKSMLIRKTCCESVMLAMKIEYELVITVKSIFTTHIVVIC